MGPDLGALHSSLFTAYEALGQILATRWRGRVSSEVRTFDSSNLWRDELPNFGSNRTPENIQLISLAILPFFSKQSWGLSQTWQLWFMYIYIYCIYTQFPTSKEDLTWDFFKKSQIKSLASKKNHLQIASLVAWARCKAMRSAPSIDQQLSWACPQFQGTQWLSLSPFSVKGLVC